MRWRPKITGVAVPDPTPKSNSATDDMENNLDKRLRNYLHGRSELLSAAISESAGDNALNKVLRAIETRRNRRRKMILATGGSLVLVILVAGIVATSSNLFGGSQPLQRSYSSLSAHRPPEAAMLHSTPSLPDRLMGAANPTCAAGAIDGRIIGQCVGTIATITTENSPGHAVNSGIAAHYSGSESSAPASAANAPPIPSCTLPLAAAGNQPPSPTISSHGEQATATLRSGDYLEIALVPLSRSARWVLLPPVTGGAAHAGTPSRAHIPVATLCTIGGPKPGGLIVVARAVNPGTQMISAEEIITRSTCAHGLSRSSQSSSPHSNGSRCTNTSRQGGTNSVSSAYRLFTYRLVVAGSGGS